MKTKQSISYSIITFVDRNLESEIFSVFKDNELIYDRDYGSLTKSIEEYIEDYRKWESAPTIAMRNADVYDAVNDALKCLESFRSNIDGETINYIVKQMGYESNLKDWQNEVKLTDDINSLTDYIEKLEHRLKMVNDDCNALRNFISKNALEIFNKPSCDEAMSHLSNINIACDLNSNESLSWKLYSNN